MNPNSPWPAAFICVGLIVAILATCSPSAKDVTDPPNGVSGMGLHTDHETGCQYLSRPFGGITPRMSARGEHMGCTK